MSSEKQRTREAFYDNMKGETHVLMGLSPSGFLRKHSDFVDLKELYENFSLHCDDYLAEVDCEILSKAGGFCFMIIKDIHPQSVNKKMDQKWIITMKVGVTTHKILI